MSITHTADATLPSAPSPAGLSRSASYDRVVWNGMQDVVTMHEAEDIIRMGLDALRSGNRTRFLARFRLEAPLPARGIEILRHEPHVDIADYTDRDDGSTRLTVGINTPVRAIDEEARMLMQRTVEQTVERYATHTATPRSFTEQGVRTLRRAQEQGFSFDTSASPRELFALWEKSFGWTREQCARVCSQPGERIFALRDDIGDAIAAVLYSQGETTEWSVSEAHQGRGTIVPLLLYSHCALLRENIRSVFAELRWNRSVSPGLQSGLRPALAERRPWLLTNHVTIGDPSSDLHDEWNAHCPRLSDGTDGRQLRSFAVASLDPDLFTDELMDAYLLPRSR